PRLHALMDEAGLDALVLRSGQNFTYLSGVVYPGTLARHMDLTDSTRPVVIVWPRHGKPVIMTNKTAAGLVERDGWIADYELYEAYVEDPNKKLSELIQKMGLGCAAVGCERNYGRVAHWEALQKAAPK